MYKPLPDSLTIKDSGIHGLGLFAKEEIPLILSKKDNEDDEATSK